MKEKTVKINYTTKQKITLQEFIDILNRSTLGERRPVDDEKCIQGMLDHADILVLAMDGEKIVGVARAISDFNYACYLSDLAVDVAYQKMGIGEELIKKVKEQLEEGCKIILLSAPAAVEYYPKVGFTQHPSAWVLA
ncbi:MAG: GNAT family N-acetyltransferase [uncultured Sulfurovum sp.]|uniref:GNAT family N-acetyltransferase n=1 Tax=uncultured Sulfurovum sp. TaxID=269237 RepID=A0A6S6U670_9BACT|nr:MAG: GNAT family N-acetyltransferase [uncultured Sulfurovum sp.]